MSSSLDLALPYLKEKLKGFSPEIGLILGSGMGDFAAQIRDPLVIPYHDIPGFPRSTVEGHKGQWVCGTLQGRKVMIMQGRFHYYEGYSLQTVAIPVRVMKSLGATTLVVTNAAGAVNAAYKPGDIMVIRDHLHLIFQNPLMGPNDSTFGTRFPDTSNAYPTDLAAMAQLEAQAAGLTAHQGVYLMNTGPSYETPAEVRMAKGLGADAVGMSTVPEVIAAVHAGMRVLGISYIANMAAGLSTHALSHQEVMDTMTSIKEPFTRFLTQALRKI
jgi:purine-nucleoside phosphorylase